MALRGFLFVITSAMLLSSLSATRSAAAEVGTVAVLPGEFGLVHGLRWGTSIAEARGDLPDLAVAPDLPMSHSNLLVLDDPQLAKTATGKAVWAGCELTFGLRFFRDHLDEVRISTASATECRGQIESALFARYHENRLPLACPNVIHRHWNDANTDATYDYDCDEFSAGPIYKANANLQLRLRDTADVSGRVADRMRWEKCRRFITVEVFPGEMDGASDPALSTGGPDLGCNPDEYPAISERLLDTGAAILQARFSDDGVVQDAELVGTSGKKRLDDGALALVRDKLRFRPAQKHGMPVPVTRQLYIDFRLANLVFSNATVGYACNLPGTNPCNGAPLAIDLAPALDRRTLTVSSPVVTRGQRLPAEFVSGRDPTSPPLTWTAGPSGTKSYVLVAEHRMIVGTSVSWIMFDIPPDVYALPAGIPNDARVPNPAGAVNVGRAGAFPGYTGFPQRMQEHFQIFALNTKLELDPISVDRASLLDEIKGHVLASGELVARGAQ